jgi:glutamine synthetase
MKLLTLCFLCLSLQGCLWWDYVEPYYTSDVRTKQVILYDADTNQALIQFTITQNVTIKHDYDDGESIESSSMTLSGTNISDTTFNVNFNLFYSAPGASGQFSGSMTQQTLPGQFQSYGILSTQEFYINDANISVVATSDVEYNLFSNG